MHRRKAVIDEEDQHQDRDAADDVGEQPDRPGDEPGAVGDAGPERDAADQRKRDDET